MNWKRITFTILAGLISSPMAMASGFATAEYHTAFTAQALAGITMTENAGVLATLSAGMVRLEKGSHLLGGISEYIPKATAKVNGEKDEAETDSIVGPHAYGAWTNNKFAFGVGLYFPFNIGVDWNEDWAGRRLVTSVALNVGQVAPRMAWAINDNFSIGGGINFIGGRVTLERKTVINDETEIPTELGGSATALGWSASAMYDDNHWSFGVQHSPNFTLRGKGKAAFDTSDAPSFTGAFPDGDLNVDIMLPSLTDFAIAFKEKKENPRYFVEFAVLHTGWSNYRELRLRFAKKRPAPEQVLERDYHDTLTFRLGGNYAVYTRGDSQLKLRGGFAVDQSPIPEDTLDPQVPDGKGRNNFGIGLGYKTGKWLIDAGYFVTGIMPSETNTNEELKAEYTGSVPILTASLGYHF